MHGETFEKVLERRIERRQFLKGAIGTILVSPIVGVSAPSDHLKFQPIGPSTVDAVLVPPGYSSQVLAKWVILFCLVRQRSTLMCKVQKHRANSSASTATSSRTFLSFTRTIRRLVY